MIMELNSSIPMLKTCWQISSAWGASAIEDLVGNSLRSHEDVGWAMPAEADSSSPEQDA
mgnify:CR=1 FL=1